MGLNGVSKMHNVNKSHCFLSLSKSEKEGSIYVMYKPIVNYPKYVSLFNTSISEVHDHVGQARIIFNREACIHGGHLSRT